MKKAKVVRIIKTIVSIIFAVALIVGLMLANPQLKTNKILSNIMNYNRQSIDNSQIKDKNLDLNYYKADYNVDTIKAAENRLASNIAEQGTVLLKNQDDALPLKSGAHLSLFSANSVKADGANMLTKSKGVTAKEVLEQEGFKVNDKLWQFYSKDAGKKYGLAAGSVNFGDGEDFRINEASIDVLKREPGLLDSVKGTVPVYLLSRVAGEGRDMPRSMYNHASSDQDKRRTYLEPDSNELSVLNYLNQNFDNVVLVVKSNAALDLGWLDQFPHIRSVVYSENITRQLAGVLSGRLNPSGRTVDTFARHALDSPAAHNFGDYQYYNKQGKPTKYNYLTYAEGIYVGYRYYETRYEDKVLGQGNAGDFDHAREVIYPFGYGLSYTTFDWRDFHINQEGDRFVASLVVENTGNRPGRDVVELYAQSPYTEYDKANGVEKSAVDLVGYAKTPQLQPGAHTSVKITFGRSQLKAYDAKTAKTFIFDAGEYRFTAAHDAHDAVNNILAQKGRTINNGMTAPGNPSLVASYTPTNAQVDVTTFSKDAKTGKKITNLFDFARADTTYLSRADWTGTFPKHDGVPSDQISTWGGEINGEKDGHPKAYTWKKIADDSLIAKLDGHDSGTPVARRSIHTRPVFGKDNKRSLIEMRGLPYESKEWDALLDQMTEDDYWKVTIDAGYGLDFIKSVGKPYTMDADAANGLFYGGTGKTFPNVMMLAQSFNHDLAEQFGKMIGNEALLGGASGWYAPSMDIHRTPFSGRNGEYYSEDPFLSGSTASAEVSGAASKGVYTYIKHFALNDQEDHRGDRPGNFSVATWANEQSIRQIYLSPFEACIKAPELPMKYVKKLPDGSYKQAIAKVPAAMGVMSSFNRIGATWTGGSYQLMTKLLRQEWGFNGLVITDNANTGVFMSPYQMIEAGADAKLLNVDKDPTGEKLDFKDPATYQYARQAAHHMLYAVANSKAMNGAMPGSRFRYFNVMNVVRYSLNVAVAVIILLLAWFTFRRHSKTVIVRKEAKRAARRLKRQAKKSDKAI